MRVPIAPLESRVTGNAAGGEGVTLDANVRASLCMALSMTGFACGDALVKSLDGRLPTAQVMFVRGVILCALIVPVLWRRGLLPRLGEARHRLVLARAVVELGATVLFLAAIVRLPFASISAILQSLPLAVTLGAALFLGEVVGWRRWIAILVGFGGVLLVVRPGSAAFEPATLLVVACVGFAAARDLFTRMLPPAIPSLLVTAVTCLVATGAGGLWGLVARDWVAMTGAELAALGACAACLFVGYQFIVLAMRGGEIAYVVPYRYTSLLVAVVLGALFFDEIPDGWTFAGAATIVATGLFSLYRELAVKRRARVTRAVVPAGTGVALPTVPPPPSSSSPGVGAGTSVPRPPPP